MNARRLLSREAEIDKRHVRDTGTWRCDFNKGKCSAALVRGQVERPEGFAEGRSSPAWRQPAARIGRRPCSASLSCARFWTMQAVTRSTSGISEAHSRIASPVHICSLLRRVGSSRLSPARPVQKLVAISILQARTVEAVKVIECPLIGWMWQRMQRLSSCAGVAPSLGRRTSAAMVSGFFVASAKVFRRGEICFVSATRGPQLAAGYRAVSTTFRRSRPRLAMSLQQDRL